MCVFKDNSKEQFSLEDRKIGNKKKKVDLFFLFFLTCIITQ